MMDDEPDWAKISVRLFVCIAGILGNFLVIFVIIVLKEYKKAVTHWYVLQLAIADSIFLLTLPFKVDEEIHNRWKFTSGMCKGKETILFLNYYASILFLVIMSVDRYIAVCHGFSDSLQKLRTHSAAFIITAAAWIIALIICTPVMLYSHKAGIEPNCTCQYRFPKPIKSAEEVCIGHGFTNKTDSFYAWCICTTTEDQKKTKQQCLPELRNIIKEATNPNCDHLLTFETPTNTNSSIPDYSNYDFGGVAIELLQPTNDSSNTIQFSDYSNLPSTSITSTNRAAVTSTASIGPECNYFNMSDGWRAFLIFNFTGMFIVPFFIMAFCYLKIILKLRETRVPSDQKRTKSAATNRVNAERNRITTMCAVLVVLFLVCWLPFHSIHMAKISGIKLGAQNERWCTILTLLGSLIAYTNSALNPYLYNFLGTGFINRIKKVTSMVSTVKSINETSKDHKRTRNDELHSAHQRETTMVETKVNETRGM